jgi:FkbM family methyltransferase
MSQLKPEFIKDEYVCGICYRFAPALRPLARTLERLALFCLARPGMQVVNDILLALALKGRGYNNCCTFEATGESRFLENLSKLSLSNCIDIGANLGDYSRALLTTTRAKVLAFEPLPLAFEKLCELKAIDDGRFMPIDMGLGDQAGTYELRFGMTKPGLASFEPSTQNIGYVRAFNRNSVDARVTTLDEFSRQSGLDFDFANIDLIKIDTEGYEYKVLTGARELLAQHPPKFIQMEFNWHQLFTGHSLYDFHLLLRQFDIFQLLPYGRGIRRVDPLLPENNFFSFSNFVFVRKDITPAFKKAFRIR